MGILISPAISAEARRQGGGFSLRSIDLGVLGERASPVLVLDDFRVRGQPFPPHPHAGFAAVTYVFEDSEGAVRSRSSLGNDVVVGPGGIVWTESGSGVIHEEVPADPGRELHGLQIFVNLSARHKLSPPRMIWLDGKDVPEWASGAGDRVRVVVGSFGGISSPLAPVEPFSMLAVELQHEISIELPAARNGLAYVVNGSVEILADDGGGTVTNGQAVALYGGGGSVRFNALRTSNVIFLAGPAIDEPVVVSGSFIMNEPSQIDAAVARYRAGEMGHLAPISKT